MGNNNGKFYEWLRRQRSRTDDVGDLGRFVFWDKSAPKQTDDPDKWREFCQSRTYPFLIAAFEQSWYEYNQFKT